MMNLIISLPSKILLKKKVTKINAEAIYGHFTLLPKHVDFVAPLETSILILSNDDGESYAAIDGGVLVKKEDDVWISTPRGMLNDDLDQLEADVEEQWNTIQQTEEKAKTAMAKLESDTIRRYVDWRKE
jgi:F-type H+-transporting ATPase subunit epsilon